MPRGLKADGLLKDIYLAFGWKTRLTAPFFGRFAHFTLKREEARLAAGWTYEPRSLCEKNAAALVLEKAHHARQKAEAQKIRPLVDQPAATFGK